MNAPPTPAAGRLHSTAFLQGSRQICRGAVTAALLSTVTWTMAGAQESAKAERQLPPPIAERVQVLPLRNQVGAFSPLRRHLTRIHGIVLDAQGLPLPLARTVAVRNLADGQLTASVPVDGGGRFAINGIAPGVYLAELVNGTGEILAATRAFALAANEIVQLTPVVASPEISGLAAVLGSGTAAAVTSALSAGILTIAPLPSRSPE